MKSKLAAAAAFPLGGLVVRPATLEVAGGGGVEILEPRVMQVLVALARRRGQVVSHDELIAECWDGRVVGEEAIYRCVSAIRRLGRKSGGFSLTTIPRVGFRLDDLSPPGEAIGRSPSLAVLAFDNLSGDPNTDYFSDGISEEILLSVARIADLRVIGRASSFQFRGAQKAAANVAAQLQVTHVLDGSVRRSGSQVRVLAHLVDCASETVVWSDRFDRDLADIFALQDEVAAAVAAALRVGVSTLARPLRAIDPKAHDALLKGRALAVYDPKAAEGVLTVAIERAPDCAAAWGARALARGHYGRYDNPAGFADELIDATRRDAETALSLDPRCSVALTALSYLEPYASYGARERWLQDALAASPGDATTLVALAGLYASVGFFERAFEAAELAYLSDPLWVGVHNWRATTLEQVGRWSEALEVFAAARARWPKAQEFNVVPLAQAAIRGDWAVFDDLAAKVDRALPRVRDALFLERVLRHPAVDTRARLAKTLSNLLESKGTVPLGVLTTAYRAGLADEVFDAVERASYRSLFDPTGRNPGGWYSASMLFSDARGIWRDPRFVKLSGKLGLNAYWSATDQWPDIANELPPSFRDEVRADANR